MTAAKVAMVSIESIWQEYQRRILPVSASPTQRQETRRAIYSGCYRLLVILRDDVAALPEPMALIAIEALHQECQEFAAAVGRGEA